jgi:hypothetical protein
MRRAWDEVQGLLDVVLGKFETRFLEPFKVLDELLAKGTPATADVKRLRNNTPQNSVTLGYFFEKLQSPAWLPLLRKEEFFAHPPEPKATEEGTILPLWPASRYLARMAAVAGAQEAVLDIVLAIPETANVRVYEDLADAARALPSHQAARLGPRLEQGIALPHQVLLPEKVGALVAHLASGAETAAALRLADRLLEVRRKAPRQTGGEGEPDDFSFPEAEGDFNEWRYRQILTKHIPTLVSAVGLDALRLLARRLDEALALSSRRGHEDKPDDYSAIWRPAIEDRGKRHGRGVKDLLVSAVRDTAEQLVRENASCLPNVVRVLEEHGWHVFERIVLHLLLTHPEGGDALVRARLTDRGLFDESERRQLRREYRRLAREQFGKLPPEDQALTLEWIDAGPALDDFRTRFEEWQGRAPTEEEVARHVKQWRLDHLGPIAQALAEPWKRRYDTLVTELGPPPDADFAVEIHAVWRGPTSPLSADELKAKPVRDIVEYLKTWEPAAGFMVPSREGVGRALTEAVAADPARFVSELEAFRGLHPTYVRSVLEGLSRALAEKRSFDWAAVLDLSHWVVNQPREFPPGAQRRGDDEDLDWSWTRKTIARLLMAGLEAGECSIPVALRERVWAVLRPLTDDPHPTPREEADWGGGKTSPHEVAINTVRGDAMHGVVEYALWLRRQAGEGPRAQARAARGFDEMPEVREVLDRHLDPGAEPSPAIRSAYGRYLPWLILLDKDWVTRNLARIFPEDPALSDLRDAAWETYIVCCPPYNDPLAVLGDEYGKAIDRIGTKPARTSGPGNPDEHLGDHLMVFYWRGKLALDKPDSLLARFYAKAGTGLRRDAIEFLGRMLGEAEVEAEVKERLTRLWDSRVKAALASGELRELETFGWWFGSAKLDEQSALTELLGTLRITKRIDPDFLVLDRLRELAPRRPGQAVECLRQMLEGAREPWEFDAWGEEMEKILRAALRSGNAAAETEARELVNLLAARGHLRYRELLNP